MNEKGSSDGDHRARLTHRARLRTPGMLGGKVSEWRSSKQFLGKASNTRTLSTFSIKQQLGGKVGQFSFEAATPSLAKLQLDSLVGSYRSPGSLQGFKAGQQSCSSYLAPAFQGSEWAGQKLLWDGGWAIKNGVGSDSSATWKGLSSPCRSAGMLLSKARWQWQSKQGSNDAPKLSKPDFLSNDAEDFLFIVEGEIGCSKSLDRLLLVRSVTTKETKRSVCIFLHTFPIKCTNPLDCFILLEPSSSKYPKMST